MESKPQRNETEIEKNMKSQYDGKIVFVRKMCQSSACMKYTIQHLDADLEEAVDSWEMIKAETSNQIEML